MDEEVVSLNEYWKVIFQDGEEVSASNYNEARERAIAGARQRGYSTVKLIKDDAQKTLKVVPKETVG